MQLIKGESSYWINKNRLTKTKFEWQDDYFAISVSESVVNKVRIILKIRNRITKRKHFGKSMMKLLANLDFKKQLRVLAKAISANSYVPSR